MVMCCISDDDAILVWRYISCDLTRQSYAIRIIMLIVDTQQTIVKVKNNQMHGSIHTRQTYRNAYSQRRMIINTGTRQYSLWCQYNVWYMEAHYKHSAKGLTSTLPRFCTICVVLCDWLIWTVSLLSVFNLF